MAKILKKTDVNKNTDLVSKPSISSILSIEDGGVLNKKVLNAKEKAEAIIDDAVKEAERVRAEARAVLSKVNSEMEKAKKDGFAKGHDEGQASVTEQLMAMADVREKFYAEAEPEIIKLVMMIAEKIIGKIVRENESAIKSIVHQAVESSLGERITVRISPEDYKIITADDLEFKDIFDRTKRIAFKEDETIKKGGCVVETEVGTIDARLETQLKAIKKALEL